MEKYKPYAFLLLGSILYCLGFPNIFNILIPFAPILGTAILIHILVKAETTKQRLFLYFFYNSCINLISFYWITKTLQEFGHLPFIVAALMNACYAFIFNPHYWIFIFIYHYVLKKDFKINFKFRPISTFIIAILFTVIEYFLPQQFPVMLGQPWIVVSKYLGLAPYFGLPLFSFVSYLLAIELALNFKEKKFSKLNFTIIIVIGILNPIIDLNEKVKPEEEITEYGVRVVQANISNFLKTESESGGYSSSAEVLERYESLSEKEFYPDKKLDLIIWPETAYPFPIYTNKTNLLATKVPTLFQKIIYHTNAAMLIGGYDHFRDGGIGNYYKTEYNSALYFNSLGQLEDVYHKHILIPFGETLPFGDFNEIISDYIPDMAFFAEGSKKTVFEADKKIKFIASICYEILRPEFIREYLNKAIHRPHLMINLTNDSWYGNTVEPELHLFLARWRAIEFNLPILRATNTGISVLIDKDSTEVERMAYGKTGNLDLVLKLPSKISSEITYFQKYGFWGILPLWFVCFIFHIILIKLKHDKIF